MIADLINERCHRNRSAAEIRTRIETVVRTERKEGNQRLCDGQPRIWDFGAIDAYIARTMPEAQYRATFISTANVDLPQLTPRAQPVFPDPAIRPRTSDLVSLPQESSRQDNFNVDILASGRRPDEQLVDKVPDADCNPFASPSSSGVPNLSTYEARNTAEDYANTRRGYGGDSSESGSYTHLTIPHLPPIIAQPTTTKVSPAHSGSPCSTSGVYTTGESRRYEAYEGGYGLGTGDREQGRAKKRRDGGGSAVGEPRDGGRSGGQE